MACSTSLSPARASSSRSRSTPSPWRSTRPVAEESEVSEASELLLHFGKQACRYLSQTALEPRVDDRAALIDHDLAVCAVAGDPFRQSASQQGCRRRDWSCRAEPTWMEDPPCSEDRFGSRAPGGPCRPRRPGADSGRRCRARRARRAGSIEALSGQMVELPHLLERCGSG